MELLFDYRDKDKTDPAVTLTIPWEEVEWVHLSIASRDIRNRTALYQQKHPFPRGVLANKSGVATRDRPAELQALNWPINQHYAPVQDSLKFKRVLALPISDLTANPLRPHFDCSIPVERAIRYADGSDSRFFHLEQEPVTQVPYSVLLAHDTGKQVLMAVHHGVMLKQDGTWESPAQPPKTMWWAACPPVLAKGQHHLDRYAELDYDLRHVFGFPTEKEDEKVLRRQQEGELKEMYQTFSDWSQWKRMIQNRTKGETVRGIKSDGCAQPETGYHAVLAVSQEKLIVVHRITTITDLAKESMTEYKASDAILLDSGGSCAIWANWANLGHGGVLASQWNFREPRGAVLFLVLRGARYPNEHVMKVMKAKG